MDGLHYRKKDKTFKEDEAEFLDEEEQEKLLQELRKQNDAANLNIQRGLIAIGCIISVLFIAILWQNGTRIIIPISHINEPFESVLGSPIFAAVCSLFSIALSMYALALSSKVQEMDDRVKRYVRVKHIVLATVILGSISPVWTLLQDDYRFVELLYWSIPLILIIMYYLAFYMMNQVYEGLDELEGCKYKYKGA